MLKAAVTSDRDPGDSGETLLSSCWVGRLSFGAMFLENLPLKMEQLISWVVRRLHFYLWLHEGVSVLLGHSQRSLRKVTSSS